MTDINNLSDEDIANMSEADFAALAGQNVQANSSEEDEDKTEEVKVTEPEKKTEVEANDDDATESQEEKVEAERIEANPSESDKADEVQEAGKQDPKAETKDEVKTEADKATVNYEEAYNELFKPIKANGRTYKPESIEDIKQLMSMGLGFHKKMAAFKPHQATILMLEKAGIKENDLNFLIDVHNRVPTAINKLVKDSGIDPMDLSAEKAAEYKQSNHRPGENEVNLEFVLQDLKDSDHFTKVVEVANGWDSASKAIVNQHPEILHVIHGNIENGFYDRIMDKVESERALGRLKGLSDLEAYRQVGDAMAKRNEFEQQGNGHSPSQQTKNAPAVVQPKPKQAEDSKRKEAKHAAAPTKGVATAANKSADFNPLAVSDEDFAKMSIPSLK